jgi:putative membrane-bound dehydrogenase-like protein
LVLLSAIVAAAQLPMLVSVPAQATPEFRLATFSADVTPPLGHPLLGGTTTPPPAHAVDDLLFARGLVLIGGEMPVVIVAIDWCEIRNDAYDRWRDVLAEAAGTTRQRVLVGSVHQHDTPLADLEAQRVLDRSKLGGSLIDLEFHERCVQRTASALRDAVRRARRVTHIGTSKAKVDRVASNRRYLGPDGQPRFDRSSMSGGAAPQRDAPEQTIDPFLHTISFWDGDTPLCALHVYAVHPMSHWGSGRVTADFPGLARSRRQADDDAVFQIYASGCSGNVTAGKYNDGDPANKQVLADRLYRAMVAGWETTERRPLEQAVFRNATLALPPRDSPGFTLADLQQQLEHPDSKKRCLAALGLSWRKRLDAGQPIDLPALDLGSAVVVLLPGESYVEFQLVAQSLRADAFVLTLGYGESAAGYVPIEQAWGENDGNLSTWCWTAPGAERVLLDGMREVLTAGKSPSSAKDDGYKSDLPRVPPKEPADALASFRLRPGFRIELVAAEPLVRDPVALEFDESGRAYVAEMPEYNQYANPNWKGRGAVKLLEDVDGDGRFDRSTVFLDEVDSPTALACWDGGVFVGSVPHILYCKDTDGDGRADVRRPVLSGFSRDPAGEGMLNSFRWGLDNRIHISTSLAGGDVRSADELDARPVAVRGQGIVFDPRTNRFELTSGGGQHGMSMDDWGRKFVCSNSEPTHTLMYDGRYLARNPYLEAPAAAVNVAPDGKFTKLFRISPNEPWRVLRTRLRSQGIVAGSDEGGQPSGFFTGATGVTVYRGDAWPDAFRGNAFVGEVANNLIYRATIEPSGVGVVARRADPDAEFLASTDTWFRPVQLAHGPDGALYVVDMYRELIEGAAFLPPQILKHMDVSSGSDRGRIYRVVPDDFRPRAQPRLHDASTAELVALLEHRNGWHRDTASRLLYERQDRAAIGPLRTLARSSQFAVARAHAAGSLDGLGALDDADVIMALDDRDQHVRAVALRLAERFATKPAVATRMTEMTSDDDLGVRYQLAFSLGAAPGDARDGALARLAVADGGDVWMRLAILSSVGDRLGDSFRHWADAADLRRAAHGRTLLATLATHIAASGRKPDLNTMVDVIERLSERDSSLGDAVVRAVIAKQPAVAREYFAGRSGAARRLLDRSLAAARAAAVDRGRPEAERLDAVRTLALGNLATDRALFAGLLSLREPPAVQAAAMQTLGKTAEPAVADLVIEMWPAMAPQLRASATELLLSRPAWLNAFLDAVERGSVARGDVDPARIQLLDKHPDEGIRSRAARLFGQTPVAGRADVVEAYRTSLVMKGDAVRGKEHFKKVCAVCHRLEGVGESVGADLAAIRDRGLDAVLLNILDPNREVKPQFLSYLLATDAGRVLTGMIAAETATSITIRQADGASETVLRVNIEELRSTGVSYMPEGLEKQLDPAAMADLLAYLNSIR